MKNEKNKLGPGSGQHRLNLKMLIIKKTEEGEKIVADFSNQKKINFFDRELENLWVERPAFFYFQFQRIKKNKVGDEELEVVLDCVKPVTLEHNKKEYLEMFCFHARDKIGGLFYMKWE